MEFEQSSIRPIFWLVHHLIKNNGHLINNHIHGYIMVTIVHLLPHGFQSGINN